MTRDGRSVAARLAVPLLLVLVVVAFFHRTLLGERFYAVDFYQTFVPLRAILADAWSQGMPFWTGRLGNGAPILANPGYALLYLPNLVYLGTDPARAMTALTVAHFVAGALGAWFLARRWEMSRAASWTAAVAFALSGAAVSSTAYPNLSWPLAWLPWALLAHEDASHGRAWRGIAALAFVWFSMLSMGDPVVLAAALAGSALIALRDLTSRVAARPWGARLATALARPGAAAAAALILASPLLLAIVRYLPASVRGAGFKAEGIVQWSLHPLLLVGTILRDPFGDPSLTGPAGFWANALAADRGRPLLAGLYVGGLLVALALLGALRRSPYRVVLLAWLGILVALALGKYGPIYPLFGDLAGFDALRYPTKWIVPAMLPLALLAASGLDSLGESAAGTGVHRKGLLVFLSVLALLALTSVGSMAGLDRTLASLSGQPDLRIGDVPLDVHVRSSWVAAAGRSAVPLGLALLTLVFGARSRAASRLLPAVAAIATLDVALANHPLAPTVTADFYDVPQAASVILSDPGGHGRVFVDDSQLTADQLHFVDSPRLAVEAARPQRERMIAYVAASAGLDQAYSADTEAFSPIAYARAGVLMRGAPAREKLMLLGAAGATHVVTFQALQAPLPEPIASLPGEFHRPLLVYRNPFAVPRARVVPRLTPYDGDAGFIRAVQSGADDLFLHTALVERRDLLAAGLPAETSKEEGGRATVVAESGRSLVLGVAGPGGFLVVSDALAPGWTASLDGRPAALLRVDMAFRAVPVPAGTHRVEMRYDPW
jgi:hypothetical protein